MKFARIPVAGWQPFMGVSRCRRHRKCAKDARGATRSWATMVLLIDKAMHALDYLNEHYCA